MYVPASDTHVVEVQANLEIVAQDCLRFLRDHDPRLSETEKHKIRNTARAAIQRAIELPALVQNDRQAWLRRTKQFLGAATRLLVSLIHQVSQ